MGLGFFSFFDFSKTNFLKKDQIFLCQYTILEILDQNYIKWEF